MKLAVFDIDGTLIAGPTTEKRFFLWLLRRGLIGPRRLLAFVTFNLRWLIPYGRHVTKKNKAYLSGMETSRMKAEAREFVRAQALSALFTPTLMRLRQHQAAGDRVILLSGTLQPIAEALSDYLGVDEAIGSLCAERRGRLSWRPPRRHPFGTEKRELLDGLCERYGVPLADVAAYGDSFYDVALLERVGLPVAVRPDKRLLKVAQQRDWEVLPEMGPGELGGTSHDTV